MFKVKKCYFWNSQLLLLPNSTQREHYKCSFCYQLSLIVRDANFRKAHTFIQILLINICNLWKLMQEKLKFKYCVLMVFFNGRYREKADSSPKYLVSVICWESINPSIGRYCPRLGFCLSTLMRDQVLEAMGS